MTMIVELRNVDSLFAPQRKDQQQAFVALKDVKLKAQVEEVHPA